MDKHLHNALKEALGKITDGFLGDQAKINELTRMAVAIPLSEIKYAKSVKLLIDSLDDQFGSSSKRDQSSAIENALINAGANAVDLLMTVLKQKGHKASYDVATILGKIGPPAVIPLLTALKEHQVDWHAVVALGETKDKRAVGPLIEALKNNEMRSTAAGALGRIGDIQAVGPLIEALKDENEWTRRQAAEALGEIGDKQAVTPLMQSLEDKKDEVRKTALRALWKLGWQPSGAHEGVEEIVRALKAGAISEQKAAEELGKIEDPRTFKPLIRLARDKNAAYNADHSINKLLDSGCAAAVPTEDLREIINLFPLTATWWTPQSCGGCNIHLDKVDFARAKQSARQELIRRGLKA